MLGNHADQIMTTPMPHSVTTQPAQHSAATEMPAPRPTSRVGDSSFLPGIGQDPTSGEMTVVTPPPAQTSMLPGMGSGEMLPGMGNFGDMLKNPMLIAAGIGAFLFLTKPGKRMLKSVGIG